MTMLTAEMVALLSERCSYRASALILNPETDFVCNAHFASVSQDSVNFHLMNRASHFRKNSRLYISFSRNGNCNAFFGTIIKYKEDSPMAPAAISVQLASKIVGTETRVSYRVPIGEKVVPSVRLTTANGLTLFPKPIDISLTGMLIEFDEAEDPNPQPSSKLGLELTLDAHSVQLKSVIKRKDGHRYGLYFPEIVTDRDINVPQPLRLITMSLERALFLDN